MLTLTLVFFALALLALVGWTELRSKPAPLPVRRSLLGALLIALTILSQHLATLPQPASGAGSITAPPR